MLLLQVQNTTRLCIVRDLTEHDVVSRIMRKENYLIGMLNKGVLALHVSTPCFGLRKRFMLTKTLEWNLHWCLLDCMFGEDFRLKPAFLEDAKALQKRFRCCAFLHVAAVRDKIATSLLVCQQSAPTLSTQCTAA